MKILTRAAASAFLALFVLASAGFAQGGDVYEVTITNLTANQIIGPPTIATHSFLTNIFAPGQPASEGVAAVAEDADATALVAALEADAEVFDFTSADGPLLPGKSVTLEVRAQGKFRRISAIGMLVTTNDAFFGLNNFRLDPRARIASTRVPAYDAGTEANTELCSDIPGPPCGSPGVRVTEGAEGFVHVHRGVHGIGDLSATGADWRNPTVAIRFVRK